MYSCVGLQQQALSAELAAAAAAAAAASYWENERADWEEKAMTRPNGAEIDRIGIG